MCNIRNAQWRTINYQYVLGEKNRKTVDYFWNPMAIVII